METQNTLFTDDFPLECTDVELEKLKGDFANYSTYYVVSGCSQDRRKKFDSLWEKFKFFADSHFLKQYKLNFHKRTWEMYLGCVLLENNLKIEALDEGPDFIVDDQEYIECVSAEKGDLNKPDSVPLMYIAKTPEEIRMQEVPVDKMILRMRSVIKDKLEKYKKWENINKNKPFIIALNTSELEHIQDYLGIPLIIKALFGLHFLHISQSGEKSFSWRNNVEKTNADISVDIFTNNSYKEISGIIFSDQSVLSHPEKIGDDCIFINNPFAINPVESNRHLFWNRWYAEKDKLVKLY